MRKKQCQNTNGIFAITENIHRRTATEGLPWNGQQKKKYWRRGRHPVAALNYKHDIIHIKNMFYRNISLRKEEVTNCCLHELTKRSVHNCFKNHTINRYKQDGYCLLVRINWAATSENVPSDMCSNTIAQSDQSLRSPYEKKMYYWLSKMHPVNFLIKLCECACDGTFFVVFFLCCGLIFVRLHRDRMMAWVSSDQHKWKQT